MQNEGKANAVQDHRGASFQLAKDNEAQAGSLRHTRSDRSLALFVLAIAAAAAWFARDIHVTAVGSEYDPGPRCFPLALAGCLGAWAVGAFIGSFLVVARPLEVDSSPSGDGSYGDGAPTSRSVWPALIVMAALAVYIPAISLLGFSLSTIAFAGGMVFWLGSRAKRQATARGSSWRRRGLTALAVAVVLVIVVRVLFIEFFKVQLPSGMLGLPF